VHNAGRPRTNANKNSGLKKKGGSAHGDSDYERQFTDLTALQSDFAASHHDGVNRSR
jgi:hypothetical protein